MPHLSRRRLYALQSVPHAGAAMHPAGTKLDSDRACVTIENGSITRRYVRR